MPDQSLQDTALNTQTVLLENVEYLNSDVVRVRLGPRTGTAHFVYAAGQYLALHLSESKWRCYSMVRAYESGASLELHVRLHQGGLFSEWIRQHADQGLSLLHRPIELGLSGPYGNCTWQPPYNSHTPTVMLATGTGIAPIHALLEEALPSGNVGPVALYWGGGNPQDLYLIDQLRHLEQIYPGFRFVPVMREPVDGWSGRVGSIEQCAASDYPDLSQSHVYACGSPFMVQSAVTQLVRDCGLKEDYFHADPFEHAVPSAAGPEEVMPIDLLVSQSGHDESLVHARAGVSLMTALAEAGLTHGICGGRAACGNCRVSVQAGWLEKLPEPLKSERRLLASFDDAAPGHRLSCQITLTQELHALHVAIATPAV